MYQRYGPMDPLDRRSSSSKHPHGDRKGSWMEESYFLKLFTEGSQKIEEEFSVSLAKSYKKNNSLLYFNIEKKNGITL